MEEINPLLRATFSRSRKGAWIEILPLLVNSVGGWSRSRKGAWIEIGAYQE